MNKHNTVLNEQSTQWPLREFVLQHTHVLLSQPGSVLGGGLLSLQQLGLSAKSRSSTWTPHCQDCPSLRSGRDPLLKRLFSVSELIPN